MEDIPPGMPFGAYGKFEAEGLCIRINADSQACLSAHAGVVAHEFAHYVQTISTAAGVRTLLSLMFGIHSRVQRLEEVEDQPVLPLNAWAAQADCPSPVRDLAAYADQRRADLTKSRALHTDHNPESVAEPLPVYQKDGLWHVAVSLPGARPRGVPLGQRALREGMAVASKCEALGNLEDFEEKKAGRAWHYIAAHFACSAARDRSDDMAVTKHVCDIALCSSHPDETFVRCLRALAEQSPSASESAVDDTIRQLYEVDCRSEMQTVGAELKRAHEALPPDHKGEIPSWAHVTCQYASEALRLRGEDPLCLGSPDYTGVRLRELANDIGSPVVVTNDGRLTLLNSETSGSVRRAVFSVRALTKLCRWIIEGGQLVCPYAGCPGCHPTRADASCGTDARVVITKPDDLPWCALTFAAKQLRIVGLVKASLDQA